MMRIPLSGIINFLRRNKLLGETFILKADIEITGFSALKDTVPGSITWIKNFHCNLRAITAAAVICPEKTEFQSSNHIVFIPVKNPRTTFARILSEFYPFQEKNGIEPTVKFGENCIIGNDVYIGHYTILGNNVTIGDGTIIYGHVSIYDRVKIGSHCLINSGTVIGADGFGYEKAEDGQYFKFPHIGSVIIEDHVEIGSNTSIDRGVLGNTLIKENAKIDNLCHIAHNVVVGKNSMVIAQAMLGGSVVLAENTWIAPGAVIKNGLHVGRNALVGLGAVVLKDVADDDIVAGVPAYSIKDGIHKNS